MSKQLRQQIKQKIAILPEGWQDVFKLMYGEGTTAEDKKSLPIDSVIDNMPTKRLKWALTQVNNSIIKRMSQI